MFYHDFNRGICSRQQEGRIQSFRVPPNFEGLVTILTFLSRFRCLLKMSVLKTKASGLQETLSLFAAGFLKPGKETENRLQRLVPCHTDGVYTEKNKLFWSFAFGANLVHLTQKTFRYNKNVKSSWTQMNRAGEWGCRIGITDSRDRSSRFQTRS